MTARRAELVDHVVAQNLGVHARTVRLQRQVDEPRIGLRVLAERHDCCGARGLRGALKPLVERAVAVDHRGAVRLEPEKNLGLGVGDRLDRVEKFEMHRFDRRDDRNVRPHQPRQRRDLACVIHADLENGEMRALRQPRQGERHAPMVVVGRRRRVGLALSCQHQAQGILGPGLADRSGDRDDAGARATARRGGEIAQGGEHVGNQEKRRIRRHGDVFFLRDDAKRRAAFERGRDKIVAIAVLAQNREERVLRLDAAAVDGKPADCRGQRPRARSSHRRGHRRDGPQRAIAHATLSSSAAKTAS